MLYINVNIYMYMYLCICTYYYKFFLLITGWPSIGIVVDEVCVTSIKFQLTRRLSISTCHLSLNEPYLMSSSGREISRYTMKSNQYQFTGLSPNTRHSIHILLRFGTPQYHRLLLSHVTTRASLCKFPKYNTRQCMYIQYKYVSKCTYMYSLIKSK